MSISHQLRPANKKTVKIEKVKESKLNNNSIK